MYLYLESLIILVKKLNKLKTRSDRTLNYFVAAISGPLAKLDRYKIFYYILLENLTNIMSKMLFGSVRLIESSPST